MFDTFELPFVRDGLVVVCFLAVAAGLLGTWIVLRGLAFYSHAVAAASFPGLVVAGGVGFAAPIGAFAAAGLFAATVGRFAARERHARYDTITALVLVAALALGVILASDVYDSGSQVGTYLFGSLLAIDTLDQVLAAAGALASVAATLAFGPRWLATGFDPTAAGALGVRSPRMDFVLLTLVAFVAVSTLAAVGALLAGALLVIPAATARLWTRRLWTWQVASVLLAAAEGVFGLWLSVELNAPPGATIAVLAAVVFALAPLPRLVRPRHAAVATAGLLLLAGCGGEPRSGAPSVVATTTQVADFARAVGGDRVEVHQILRANTDPHEYEPRPHDVTATADARVVLTSGGGLDEWMDEVVEKSGSDAIAVSLAPDEDADGGANAEHDAEDAQGHSHEGDDPHWWHDPRNVIAAVERIRRSLVRAIPAEADAVNRNARAYKRRIRALDARIARCIRSVPPGERKLVTSHGAFAHLASRYDIQLIGAIIPSRSSEAQASAGDVERLVEQVRRERVRAVFIESSANPKLGEAVARAAGVVGDLRLWGDTLGPPGSPAATYVGMARANADALVRGFTGGKRGCR